MHVSELLFISASLPNIYIILILHFSGRQLHGLVDDSHGDVSMFQPRPFKQFEQSTNHTEKDTGSIIYPGAGTCETPDDSVDMRHGTPGRMPADLVRRNVFWRGMFHRSWAAIYYQVYIKLLLQWKW